MAVKGASEIAAGLKPKDNSAMCVTLACLVGFGFAATRFLPVQETASRDAVGLALVQQGCVPLNPAVIQTLSEGMRITTATGETLAPGTVVCTQLGDIAVVESDGRVGEVAGGRSVREKFPEILDEFVNPNKTE